MAKKEAAPNTGRPRFGDEKLQTTSLRLNTAQREKLEVLGGAAWLRDQIDAAKWPRGTKPA